MYKVSGTWSYPNWFANWLIPLVHRNNAIVVSPNYRLIPEHNGDDIQQDLSDFWTWYAFQVPFSILLTVHSRFKNEGVTEYLSGQAGPHAAIQIDYARVLAAGDSAGGYLAIQSGLTQPRGTVSAIIGCYPMTNYLRRKEQIMFMGEPSPPESIINVSFLLVHWPVSTLFDRNPPLVPHPL